MPRTKKTVTEHKKEKFGSASEIKTEVVTLENGETATIVTYPDGTTRKIAL